MSKYFEPDERYKKLEEMQKEAEPEKVPEVPEDIDEFVSLVEKELSKIGNGTSELCPRALMLESNTPCVNGLRIFKEEKSSELLKKFLELATQDLGARVGDYFQEAAVKLYPLAENWEIGVEWKAEVKK